MMARPVGRVVVEKKTPVPLQPGSLEGALERGLGLRRAGREDWGNCRNGGRRPIGRHNGMFTAIFADGHVKAMNARVLRDMGPNNPNSILHNNQ
jgi:prepilin-type processing-associated H-X9-DG protein